MTRTWRVPIALALLLCVFSVFFADAVLAQQEPASPAEQPSLTSHVRSKAGGWGLLTPVILFVSRAVDAVGMKDATLKERADHSVRFLKAKKFWSGLTVDMTFAWLFAGLSAAMPGGPFLKAIVAISGGFLGWEVGTGNLGHTDWINLFGQIVAAAGVHVLLSGMGVGSLVTLLASAATAIATGMILDHLRGIVESEEPDESSRLYATGDDARVHRARRSSKTAASLDAERKKLYATFLEKLRRNDPRADVESAWKAFLDRQEGLDALREESAGATR